MILKNSLRDMDIAGRYGGEEFLIALPETDEKTGNDIADRIRRRIQKTCDTEPTVTVSVGVASFPAHAGCMQTLIHSAVQALLEAKRKGKNRFCCYSDIAVRCPGQPA